jgi:hypothetical protein
MVNLPKCYKNKKGNNTEMIKIDAKWYETIYVCGFLDCRYKKIGMKNLLPSFDTFFNYFTSLTFGSWERKQKI